MLYFFQSSATEMHVFNHLSERPLRQEALKAEITSWITGWINKTVFVSLRFEETLRNR